MGFFAAVNLNKVSTTVNYDRSDWKTDSRELKIVQTL